MKLFEKLLEIQKEVIGLDKDGKGFNYEYVTPDKIIDHVKPLMNKYGILLKQEIISIDHERIDYLNSKGLPKSEIFFKIMMKFTWVDAESLEIDINSFGACGMNDWEKGLGSALTYAERYFLLKYFHISTHKDDIDNPERKAEEQKIADSEAKNLQLQQQWNITCQTAENNLKNCKTLEELASVYTKLKPAVKKAVLKIKDDCKVILTELASGKADR